MQETEEMWVRPLASEDALEEEVVTHSSILAWKIPWTEEPGGRQSMGRKELYTTLATEHIHIYIHVHMHTHTHTYI